MRILLFYLLTFLFFACSNIDESERLIYVKPVEVARTVLIEDFTGQKCVNCPNATLAIHELQKQYGEEHVVAVAIHSGPFAHRSTMSSAFVSDLGTADGDHYFTHWGIEAQPGVMINRQATLYDTRQYAAAVAAEIQKTSPEYFETIRATLTSNEVEVSIVPSAVPVESNVRLQVWLVEDSINASGGNSKYTQFMPDGSTDVNYVHNHVFRASLTANLYGDAFAGTAGSDYRYKKTVESPWNAENLSAVVFLWTEQDGVLEVKRVEIEKNK